MVKQRAMGNRKELFVKTGIPAWLQPPKLDRGPPYPEYTVERVLNEVACGRSVADVCRSDPGMPPYSVLLRHFHSTPELEARYYEAQRIGAEGIVDEAIAVSKGISEYDGEVPMDVQRAALIVKTAQWVAARRSRRYRDTQQVEVNNTLDISEAMAKAHERVERLRMSREEKTIEVGVL